MSARDTRTLGGENMRRNGPAEAVVAAAAEVPCTSAGETEELSHGFYATVHSACDSGGLQP